MSIGIYKITCKETGRCYVGQSIDIEGRWKAHQGKRGKFPRDKFDYTIVQATSVDQLDEAEIIFIDFFDAHTKGFNKTIGGTGMKVKVVTEETRQRMSVAHKGKLKGKPGPNKGKPMSEEQKQLISATLKGKTHTEESRKRQSLAQKGRKLKPRSEEQKQAMSKALKGKPWSQARRDAYNKKKEVTNDRNK